MSASSNAFRAIYAIGACFDGSNVLASAAKSVDQVAGSTGLFANGTYPLTTAAVAAFLRCNVESGRYFPR